MPLLALPDELREDFAYEVERLVECTVLAAQRLRGAIKDALFKKHEKPKYDAGVLGLSMRWLWASAEEPFYALLWKLKQAMQEHGPVSTQADLLKEGWLIELSKQAGAIFDQLSDGDHLHQTNPKRWAQASTMLKKSLGKNTKKLREILGLPNEIIKSEEEAA